MVQENIEEQIIAELAKLKNATKQIEKAKDAVASSNQLFTQLKEQHELSKKEWATEKVNIIGEIEKLKKQQSAAHVDDNSNNFQEELAEATKMWQTEMEQLKTLVLQKGEKTRQSSDFSYSAMNKMFEQFVDTRITHLDDKMTRERKDMAEAQQKQIDSLQESIENLKKQNILLWIYRIILLLIVVAIAFMVANKL